MELALQTVSDIPLQETAFYGYSLGFSPLRKRAYSRVGI